MEAPRVSRFPAKTETADDLTNEVRDQAMNDAHAEYVMWRTDRDERVCSVCHDRDGEVYPREDAPTMPAHWRCRCWYEAARVPLTHDDNLDTMLSDTAPIRALGAASPKNPNVINSETGLQLDYVKGRRPEYPPDHIMAGYGCKTKRRIDDIGRLVNTYNAPAERWRKKRARYWVYDAYSEERQVELHWYQHPEVGQVEHEIKFGDNGEEYVDEWA